MTVYFFFVIFFFKKWIKSKYIFGDLNEKTTRVSQEFLFSQFILTDLSKKVDCVITLFRLWMSVLFFLNYFFRLNVARPFFRHSRIKSAPKLENERNCWEGRGSPQQLCPVQRLISGSGRQTVTVDKQPGDDTVEGAQPLFDKRFPITTYRLWGNTK